jgi:glutathione S-transferase
MYQLYYSPGAASFVVHWLLIELDLPHELILVDTQNKQQKSADYLKLNPNGLIPTLIIDGKAVYESPALIMHLADVKPEAKLAPAVGTLARAEYYQWLLNLVNPLQSAMRFWWYPNEAAGEANKEATLETTRDRVEKIWDRLDAHLAANGPYLQGQDISAADFMLTMLMRWTRNMPKPATEWSNLHAHATRMKSRSSFKTLYEREGLTEWA